MKLGANQAKFSRESIDLFWQIRNIWIIYYCKVEILLILIMMKILINQKMKMAINNNNNNIVFKNLIKNMKVSIIFLKKKMKKLIQYIIKIIIKVIMYNVILWKEMMN